MILLNEVEARVLGVLIEKEMSTPEYYPLTLNALVNACNQKSNREPVVAYDESTVLRALESLREKRLALVTTGSEHRVPKHSHRISETWNLGNRELAVLCELMLRGPQTPGELKAHTQRLYNFDETSSVESCLERLMTFEPEPLATKLPRQPGTREVRYAHLLAGQPVIAEREEAPPARRDPLLERVEALEAEIAAVKQELAELRQQFGDFRKEFE